MNEEKEERQRGGGIFSAVECYISSILVPYRHVKFNTVNRHAPPEILQQCC